MTLIECYFDESYSGNPNSGLLTVAGYLFESNAAKSMSKKWAEILSQKNLPYFRMSACAHRNSPFDRLNADECIEIETKCIDLIKSHALEGIAASIDQEEYNRVFPLRHPVIGGAYTFCVQAMIAGVRKRSELRGGFNKISFFFESGHQHQSEADKYMQLLFSLKDEYPFYAGHYFPTKEDTQPLQAADLLAWQYFTDLRRKKENKPLRKDYASLIKLDHYTDHISEQRLRDILSKYETIPEFKNYYYDQIENSE